MGPPIEFPVGSLTEVLSRVWDNLMGRMGGPLTFRIIVQPTVAAILAVRDGLKDARDGHPAFFWAIFTDSNRRRKLLLEGWNAISRIFLVALILDVLYQIVVHRWVYPGESLLVGILLAVVPYLLVRGPVTRIARRLR